MELFRAEACANPRQPGAQILVCGWAREKWLPQRAQVEAGSADQDRDAAATLDFLNRPGRCARPIGGGEVGRRRNKVDQMMRNTAAFGERDFRRGDFNVLRDLN